MYSEHSQISKMECFACWMSKLTRKKPGFLCCEQINPLTPISTKTLCIGDSFWRTRYLRNTSGRRLLLMLPSNCNGILRSMEINCRSSRSQSFFKIGVLKNFAIFTGKRLCWSLFFIEKRLHHRYFPNNIAKFLRTTFS